ncbi:multidrug effflux MFS transporter [Salinarimonas ramus]|uniref:Bcr/CflA family drug resistance efflux transporter n=1 Tax=Salinarimonas ramus TaxID=690164 RepID=A0A917QGX6_9HYPH|nr:multidrug effflux MFS transporter [Salinarimonas ramus]GGK49312.1 Bcr/CflA family drug resistance efflux transporter [Salinarimonas ramus]
MTRSVSQPGLPEFVAVAALLMAVVALSIDAVLPALDAMAHDLAVADGNSRQLVVTALFVGLMLGQLVFGPLSDATGRRPAIFLGVGAFVAGGLVCAAATSFEAMLAGRVLQGFGAAGPRLVTVAMVRDRFAGPAMARVMSFIMAIFILVPVIAPAIGQLVLFLAPWRVLFVITSAVALAGAAWLALRQPETLVERRPLRAGMLVAALREVIANRRTRLYTLAGAFCYGGLMGYVNASQQLFQDVYGLGELYAFVFGACALFVSGATLVNARLVRTMPMERVCRLAVAAQLAWACLALAWILALDAPLGLVGWLVFSCPTLFLLGLTFGNFNAIALEPMGRIAGLAAAVVASVHSGVSLVVAAVIGLQLEGTATPLVVGYVVCGAGALLAMELAERTRAIASPPAPR